jgi:hypothetical protein
METQRTNEQEGATPNTTLENLLDRVRHGEGGADEEQALALRLATNDTTLDRLSLARALEVWQREQDRQFNRAWRRPGGLARPAGL